MTREKSRDGRRCSGFGYILVSVDSEVRVEVLRKSSPTEGVRHESSARCCVYHDFGCRRFTALAAGDRAGGSRSVGTWSAPSGSSLGQGERSRGTSTASPRTVLAAQLRRSMRSSSRARSSPERWLVTATRSRAGRRATPARRTPMQTGSSSPEAARSARNRRCRTTSSAGAAGPAEIPAELAHLTPHRPRGN